MPEDESTLIRLMAINLQSQWMVDEEKKKLEAQLIEIERKARANGYDASALIAKARRRVIK